MTHDGWLIYGICDMLVKAVNMIASSFSSASVIRIRRLRLSVKLAGRNRGSAGLSCKARKFPNMCLQSRQSREDVKAYMKDLTT
jgi:hypothetical protein